MGAAASSGLASAARASSDDDLRAALLETTEAERRRLLQICAGASSAAGGGAAARVGRPTSAAGTFLRFVTVNDVYELPNYARVSTAVQEFRACAAADDAVVLSVLAGDFLSPCTITNLDGGVAMLRALNEVPIDYVMFGNHEFDLKTPQLQQRIKEYNGVWLNSNVTFPSFVDRDGKPLREYEILQVGDRRVAMGAFLLDDMSQFSPVEPIPQITAPADAVAETWAKIAASEGQIDAFVPLVHLNIKEDRKLGEFIAKQKDLADKTPVLIAAHDHEVYIEEAGKSLICKVGQNADNVGVIDVWWTPEGELRRAVHLIEVKDFAPDPKVQAFVDVELSMLDNLLNVPILEIPDTYAGKKLSTKNVRFIAEPMVSFLLSVVKRSMPRVELLMLQGGNVRGGTPEYVPGPFTYGDLMKEFAFETQLAIIELPGHVIDASIRSTRMPEGTKPFFLHCDEGVSFTSSEADAHIAAVNGQAFDPGRTYVIGTYQFLLCGMGNIEPLGGYCKEHGLCPALESCLPIKTYFMETCMREAWLQVLGIHQDVAKGVCGLRGAIQQKFDEIDEDGNGQLDRTELEHFVERSGKVNSKLVTFLINTFDKAGDGCLSRSELLGIIPVQ